MPSDSAVADLAERVPLSGTRLGYAILATVAIAAVVIALVAADVIAVPEGTTDLARDLLEDYGLAALFVVFVVEGAMLLYFAPSESLVPAAILVIGDSPAQIAVVLGIAVVGATIGQVALFTVAKRGGREYLLEKRWFRIGERRLDRFDAWFERWGPIAVPASNTMLFTRGMLTIPAGLAEMDTRKFALLSALGTLSFEAILAGLTVGALTLL